MKNNQSCIVVFSGGQDSTVCLYWALQKFESVEAVFFDYGQRHLIERESALKIAELKNIPLKIFNLQFFKEMGGNSLIDKEAPITQKAGELPNTFVPGRNLLFLTQAASYAYTKDIHHLVTGVCETDYSGYPDCREATIQSLAQTLSLGLDTQMTLHTPLMHLNKKETVQLGIKLKASEALAFSHTCYEGSFPPCGACPSCLLRAKGYKQANECDPLIERAKLTKK